MSARRNAGHADGAVSVCPRPVVLVAFVLACLLGLVFPASATAQNQAPNEYQVKAAYLAGFTKFVVWPEDPPSTGDPDFTVGVVGEDPFGSALNEAFAGATMDGRKIAIQHFRWDQDVRRCQMIFIPQSEKKHLKTILANVKDAGILTVSDITNFSSAGGMIGLVFDVDRIRFEINLDAASESHLKISSKLLNLARTVKGHATS
jgi:hypothetical protein